MCLLVHVSGALLLVSNGYKLHVEKALSTELSSLHLAFPITNCQYTWECSKLCGSPGFTLSVGDNVIASKDEVTYLGCILASNHLSEKKSIKSVCES